MSPRPGPLPAPDLTGYLLVGVAAILWGGQSVVAKFLLASGIPIPTLVSARALLAFLVLAAVLGALSPASLRVAWRDLPYLAALGILGMALSSFTYYFALTRLPVATAVLILYTSPLLVLGASAVLWGEPIRRRDLTGALLALLGCALVIRAYAPAALRLNALGVAGAFFGACAFAFYNLWGKPGTRRFSPWTMLVYAVGFSAAFWVLVAPPWRFFLEPHPGLIWAGLGVVVVAGTILPFACYLAGLARISAAHANLTSTLEPVAAALAAFLILGETLEWPQLLGGALTLVGIGVIHERAA